MLLVSIYHHYSTGTINNVFFGLNQIHVECLVWWTLTCLPSAHPQRIHRVIALTLILHNKNIAYHVSQESHDTILSPLCDTVHNNPLPRQKQPTHSGTTSLDLSLPTGPTTDSRIWSLPFESNGFGGCGGGGRDTDRGRGTFHSNHVPEFPPFNHLSSPSLIQKVSSPSPSLSFLCSSKDAYRATVHASELFLCTITLTCRP